MRLRPSLLKWLGFCAIGSVFTATGIWMILSGEGVGWLVALFFGAVVIVGLLQLLAASLKLDIEGFEESNIRRKKRFRWVEVSEFGTWKVSGNELVCFSQAKDTGKIAAVNRSIAGASRSLADTYSLSAEELAGLMNRFRQRALSELAEKFENSPLSQESN